MLFPIVGGVWENVYRLDGQEYHLSQHGFARDMDFTLVGQDDSKVLYELNYTEETLAKYPYKFKLCIGYALEDDKVRVIWKVMNLDQKEISFQIGAHPAFYFPHYDEKTTERGYFGFDNPHLSYIRLKEKGCADPDVSYHVPVNEEGLLPLNTHTFDIDTFIIENSQVKEVTLYDLQKKPVLALQFTAPVVGLVAPWKECSLCVHRALVRSVRPCPLQRRLHPEGLDSAPACG